MQRILVTGAGGTIGTALLRHFTPAPGQELLLATRSQAPAPNERCFDFENPATATPALQGIDTVFLLRPPQLADVHQYFYPLIDAMPGAGVRQVVFLSVQGADRASFIPHAKIEKRLRQSGLAWTFVRPSYFMQNLTTTLLDDIRLRQEIVLPAGNHPFLWIDADDIGRAIARILQQPEAHRGQIYTLTGNHYHHFAEVASLISAASGRSIRYRSPSPVSFYFEQRRRGVPSTYIGVLLLLHFLPRFQALPPFCPDLQLLTGKSPTSLPEFIEANKAAWM